MFAQNTGNRISEDLDFNEISLLNIYTNYRFALNAGKARFFAIEINSAYHYA